ncbi:MAG: hypothetical protein QS748_11825 [Candidatus Endonucleobacter bathymodioli]|uniref:Uncharacterized protein n=1 Tax=Candidatus Endonucleibacter bathymodioli TaxID=539814 RepID=A0AA90SNA8_9GAMM|nr:hypothetical protein [Candidatus Endonucleobacter bathymodioli]
MPYLSNLLRKHTTRYVLLIICYIFISGKTLAGDVTITLDDCKNIYSYLKNLKNSDPNSTEQHHYILAMHLYTLCLNIFNNKLPKQERIKFKDLEVSLLHANILPYISRDTIIPYTYGDRTLTFMAHHINLNRESILTFNFFLGLIQLPKEVGSAKMHLALKSCLDTPQLQRFITQIKEEFIHPPSSDGKDGIITSISQDHSSQSGIQHNETFAR